MNDRFRERLAGLFGFVAISAVAVFIIISPYSRFASKSFLFIIFGAWLVYAITKHGRKCFPHLFPATPGGKPLFFALVVVCFLTLVFSLDPFHSQKILMNRFFLYVLTFLAGIGIARESRVNRKVIVISFIAASIVLASGSIFDYVRFHHPPRLWTSFGRTIPFQMLPLFVAILFPYTFAIAVVIRHRFYRTLAITATILMLPVILWPGTRTTWVSVSAALLFISFFRGKRFFSAVLIILACVGVIGFSFIGIRAKLLTLPYPDKWSLRVPLYNSALAIFRDHPILGAGPGMFEVLIKDPKYSLPSDYAGAKNMLHAHNMYFELLAEMGILGLLVFLAIFSVCFREFVKRSRFEDEFAEGIAVAGSGVAFGMLFFMVADSVILVGLNEAVLFWFMLGAAL